MILLQNLLTSSRNIWPRFSIQACQVQKCNKTHHPCKLSSLDDRHKKAVNCCLKNVKTVIANVTKIVKAKAKHQIYILQKYCTVGYFGEGKFRLNFKHFYVDNVDFSYLFSKSTSLKKMSTVTCI